MRFETEVINLATVAELLVKIGADGSGLRKELAASERQLKRAFGSDALGFSKNLAMGMGVVAAALGGVGIAAVKMAADMEQNRIAFSTMLGSAAAAESMLSQLAAFAEKTPFEFAGLVQSSKKLLAYGYSAQEIIPMLTSIGDAVAAVGGSAEVLDRVTLAFGQMRAKGFVSGEEMRQLAEAGIPAWQMLANVIGKDIPTTMKLAEDKALNANAAIAGMLSQMSQKYGGMMEKQSNTITGILSNIKDKGGALMRALGDEIVEALDLKTKMKGALTFLDEFAGRVKSSGIKQALAEMIPPEVELALYAVAGVITAILLPAMYMLASATAIIGVALWKLVLIGAAVGAAFGLIAGAYKNANDKGAALIAAVDAQCEGLSREEAAALKAATGYNALAAAKANAAYGMSDPEHGSQGMGATVFQTTPAAGIGDVLGAGSGGSGGADKLIAEAKRVSEAIEKEWAQTTKTQLQQLEIWQKDQLADLEKTRVANENYERDKERVAATYSVRRIKILQDEAIKNREIITSLRDLATGMKFNANGMTGNNADLMNMAKSHEEAANSIADKWDKVAERFKTSTEAEKAVFLKNLNERKIAYETIGKDEIAFEGNKKAEIARLNEQYNQELLNRYRTTKDIQSSIDAAYNANSMTMLQAVLTEQNAIRLNDYEAQRTMMETYQEAFLAAHQTSAQLMANLYKGAFDSMSSSISDLITGAKTVGEAFAAMGQSMLKVVADYVAKWIAGKLMMAVFGKSTMAAETAAGVAAGSAMAAAWAPAAAAVSLATFGANSAPAMAGIGATYGLTNMLSVAGLASGGITTGPSLNVIGEGRYQEAVLPLSDRVFGKIAKGIDNQSGSGQAVLAPTFHIQALDGKSFERWLENGGGRKIAKYFTGMAANFEVVPT